VSSIKRYVHVDVIFGIGVYDSSKIFRAIQVTEQNHKTVKLFAGKQISFRTQVKENKSVKVTRETVIIQTNPRVRRSVRTGDYIMRRPDGWFVQVSKHEFESTYRETWLPIKK